MSLSSNSVTTCELNGRMADNTYVLLPSTAGVASSGVAFSVSIYCYEFH